jgi:hypothetical protein
MKTIGNVAIIQALRFEVRLPYRTIARIAGVSPRTAWNYCVTPRGVNVRPWDCRENRAEIVQVAFEKLQNYITH